MSISSNQVACCTCHNRIIQSNVTILTKKDQGRRKRKYVLQGRRTSGMNGNQVDVLEEFELPNKITSIFKKIQLDC